MKKLFIFLMILMVMTPAIARGDSLFKPAELLLWPIVEMGQIGFSQNGLPIMLEIIINPDKTHKVKAIELVTEWRPSGRYVLEFCYELDGK